MCPDCFASLALVVAGTVSTDGFAALAINVSRKRRKALRTRMKLTIQMQRWTITQRSSHQWFRSNQTKKNVIQQNCMKVATCTLMDEGEGRE